MRGSYGFSFFFPFRDAGGNFIPYEPQIGVQNCSCLLRFEINDFVVRSNISLVEHLFPTTEAMYIRNSHLVIFQGVEVVIAIDDFAINRIFFQPIQLG